MVPFGVGDDLTTQISHFVSQMNMANIVNKVTRFNQGNRSNQGSQQFRTVI
jgi:hypothetical protein